MEREEYTKNQVNYTTLTGKFEVFQAHAASAEGDLIGRTVPVTGTESIEAITESS